MSDSILRHASRDMKKMGQRIFVFIVGGAIRSEVLLLVPIFIISWNGWSFRFRRSEWAEMERLTRAWIEDRMEFRVQQVGMADCCNNRSGWSFGYYRSGWRTVARPMELKVDAKQSHHGRPAVTVIGKPKRYADEVVAPNRKLSGQHPKKQGRKPKNLGPMTIYSANPVTMVMPNPGNNVGDVVISQQYTVVSSNGGHRVLANKDQRKCDH